MTTPNTPANGGQILTWQERMAAHYSIGNVQALPAEHFKDAEIADLRAALAAPAIPTVDRNAVLEEVAKMLLNGIFLHDQAPAKLFADEAAAAIRTMKSAAPASVPQGDLSDDGIVKVLASFGIDADKSKYGFPELQVSTNIPGIRKVILAYLAAAQPAAQVAAQDALQKLCNDIRSMRYTMFLRPGTGQHYSYLVREDVYAYIDKALKATATPAEQSTDKTAEKSDTQQEQK